MSVTLSFVCEFVVILSSYLQYVLTSYALCLVVIITIYIYI